MHAKFPVIADWYGDDVLMGEGRFFADGILLSLKGETVVAIRELVQDGCEVKAVRINIEMLIGREEEVDATSDDLDTAGDDAVGAPAANS